jgi:hypothetical protein
MNGGSKFIARLPQTLPAQAQPHQKLFAEYIWGLEGLPRDQNE